MKKTNRNTKFNINCRNLADTISRRIKINLKKDKMSLPNNKDNNWSKLKPRKVAQVWQRWCYFLHSFAK